MALTRLLLGASFQPVPDLKPIPVRHVVEDAIELNPLPPGVHLNYDLPDTLPA